MKSTLLTIDTKFLFICLLMIGMIGTYSCHDPKGNQLIISNDCSPDTISTLECEGPAPDSVTNGFFQHMFAGTSVVESEGNYVGGEPDSTWNFYYSDASLKETGPFQSGMRNGFWIGYSAIGVKSWEGTFLNCERNGSWKIFHTDGELKEEGYYEENIRKGTWNFYDNAGNLVNQVQYNC